MLGVLWCLRKLIRCQRVRLHPKCEDKPCASTEDFRQWFVQVVWLSIDVSQTVCFFLELQTPPLCLSSSCVCFCNSFWLLTAMTTRRYPTPFFREILKRFLLHPSSLWALLVRTTVHVRLACSHLMSWIGHASQTMERVCSICLFVLLRSCVVIWRFAFSAKTVGVLWWLRKLIRCQRVRLHPKCEDKPCASTEDFRQVICPSGVWLSIDVSQTVCFFLELQTLPLYLSSSSVCICNSFWLLTAMTTRRYPTPFFREILKRFLLHPSSLWALLVRTTDHVRLACSHLLSWIGHASQTMERGALFVCLFFFGVVLSFDGLPSLPKLLEFFDDWEN